MQPEIEVLKAPRKKRRSANNNNKRRILSHKDIATAIDMDFKGVTRAKIAQTLDVDSSTITKALNRFQKIFENLKDVPDFRQVKQEILDASQIKVLSLMVSNKTLSSARLGELAKAFDVLYHAGRLEAGKSTTNISSRTEFLKHDMDKYRAKDSE